jgi:hypothetical protein
MWLRVVNQEGENPMSNDKKKIMIGVPYYKHLPEPKFELAIINLAFYLVQKGYLVDIMYKEGTVISSQRNSLFDDAKKEGYDLLSFDTDMEFSPPHVVKIIECAENDFAPVVGGLYYAVRHPHPPLVFKEDMVETEYAFRSYKNDDIPKEPFIAKGGVAIGVCYFKNEIINYFLDEKRVKKFGRPFNFWQLPNGRELGEDLSFCHRCNLENIEMGCVPGLDIGHIGKKTIKEVDHKLAITMDYHYCNDISGWMNVRELNFLYNRAKQMKEIVEIGSWKGKSTHALCSGCTEGRVTAIDHFEGTDDPIQLKFRDKLYRGAFKEIDEGKDIYEIFKKNTACFNNLRVLKMNSSEGFQKLNSNDDFEVDMTFIDGGHLYKEVIQDLKNYEPHTKKLICGHDYSPAFAEVKKAVDHYFEKQNRKVETIETIWYVEKG